ncbi:MAG: FliA/WhiG family RNA polymerase sigma factor [Candidatus Lernaella stagnicola]|nr:FliA/WhiG family RNA polymerase sigma factor [Candidatus Lernaella stagnicola]
MAEVVEVDIREYKTAKAKDRLRMRDRLIRKYTSLVRLVANRMIRKLPSQIDLNDLINTGVLGLIDAIDKFDPSRDIKFETYAEFRIRGAILDDLRSLDWVPRSIRQKIHQLQRAVEQFEAKNKRAASNEELAEEMGVPLDELQDLLSKASGVSLISFEDLGYNTATGQRRNTLEYFKEPHAENLISLLNLRDVRELLAEAIDELPKNERFVISMYYFDELTMKEIGLVLGITESRVSQIHNKAVIRLKTKLRRLLRDDAENLL